MGVLEVVSMVSALAIMFAAIGVKILTNQLINRMQNAIAMVNQTRQKTLGEFKMAQSQKRVAEQNRAMLVKKKAKLNKKLGRLRQELASMREEVEHRQQMRESMRGKLLRPTIAAPQEANPDEE